jgi:hypothetical protein
MMLATPLATPLSTALPLSTLCRCRRSAAVDALPLSTLCRCRRSAAVDALPQPFEKPCKELRTVRAHARLHGHNASGPATELQPLQPLLLSLVLQPLQPLLLYCGSVLRE